MTSMEEVLDLAIEQEELAAKTYRDLAESSDDEDLEKVFIGFADEEDKHRQSLERVRSGDLELFAKDWPDQETLLVPPGPIDLKPDSELHTIILAAMDAERRALMLYRGLAKRTEDPGVKTVLDAIAREEAHHWSILEKIYDTVCGLDS